MSGVFHCLLNSSTAETAYCSVQHCKPGFLIGYHLTNAQAREMTVDMSKDRKRGSGSDYDVMLPSRKTTTKSTTVKLESVVSEVDFVEHPAEDAFLSLNQINNLLRHR